MAESKPSAPARRYELDFLRGVALIVMTMGHPLRSNSLGPHLDFIRYHYNIYGELFSAFFMFMSAINVTNFIESAKRQPDLDPTRFYIKSSVVLFLMGFSYNMCVGTFAFIDIIQAIAIGTLFTYLLLRWRTPTWGYAAITIGLFALGWRLVGTGPVTDETFARLGRLHYFVALFGPLPWLAFFAYGILIDRIPRGKWELVAIPAFFAMFVAAHWLPELGGDRNMVVLLKVNYRYVFMNCGLMPAMFLAARRWYRSRSALGKMIESWGVESLVFLIFHWGVILLLSPLATAIRSKWGDTPAAWTHSVLTLLIMAKLVQVVARKRNQWLKSPKFGRRAWGVYIGALALWLASMGKFAFTALLGQDMLTSGAELLGIDGAAGFAGRAVAAFGAGPGHAAAAAAAAQSTALISAVRLTAVTMAAQATAARMISMFAAFLSAAAFCFLYPYVRARIRQTSMRRRPSPPAAAPGA